MLIYPRAHIFFKTTNSHPPYLVNPNPPSSLLRRKGCPIQTRWPHLRRCSPPTQRRPPLTLRKVTRPSNHRDRKTTRLGYPCCRANTASTTHPHSPLRSLPCPRRSRLPPSLLQNPPCLSLLRRPHPPPQPPHLRVGVRRRGQRGTTLPLSLCFGQNTAHVVG